MRFSTGFVAILLAAPAAALAAQAAPAAKSPAFPTDRSDVSVFSWLSRNTSLPVGRGVVVSADSVLVIVSDTSYPAAPRIHRVSFRQEATGIDFVGRTGGRSLEGDADVDCSTGQTKAYGVVLYAGTDLTGAQVAVQGADSAWRQPYAGTASAMVVGEMCGSSRATTPPPPAPTPPPAPRPAPAAVAPATPLAPLAPAAPPAPRIAPAPPSDGGPFTAQIGAFSSLESAESYWNEVSAGFAAELGGRSASFTQINAGGQTLWRVGVQNMSEAAAKRLCTALESANRGCFVRGPE